MHAIDRSCAIKADIVALDEREGGVRATLNLGHTFGHAIEAAQGYGGSTLIASNFALSAVSNQRHIPDAQSPCCSSSTGCLPVILVERCAMHF